MKIIHKYVLREHVGPLVFALSAITSLMLLNYVAKQLGNLVGKGLSWGVIGEFFALSIPFTVAMTLPMAVLVSVLYAFSRLAAENEITALKSTGVSIRRLLVPVAVGGAFMALSMIIFNDQVLPRANHRLRTLQGDIARKKPTFAIKEQVINEVAPQQFFLRTNHLDRSTNMMREVTIYDLSDPLRRRTIYADSGEMSFAEGGSDLQLTLYHGVMQEIPRETPTQLQRLFYEKDLIRVPGVANAFQRDSGDTYKSDREMSVCELQNEVARYERDFFRAYDEYNKAEAVFRRDPRQTVTTTNAMPVLPGTRAPRSRRATLGRTYCDALEYLEKRGFGKLTMLGHDAARLLLPTVANAQGQDTTRQKSDTGKAITPDSAAKLAARQDSIRRDSIRTDSIRKAEAQRPLPPGVTIVNGDTIYSGLVQPQLPPPVDSASQAPGVAADTSRPDPSLAPSSGMVAALPANVAMESSRGSMLASKEQMNQFEVEIQKKFAISAACVVFVLLGGPLALRFPRGGVGLVIGVSLGVFALYYVGLIAGEALADRAILTPFWAMWAANILFFVTGLYLLARVEVASASSRGGDLAELMDALRYRMNRRRAAKVTQAAARVAEPLPLAAPESNGGAARHAAGVGADDHAPERTQEPVA